MGKILEDFLKENRKDDETISKTLMKELLIVEEEIKRRQENLNKAQKSIKENDINIKYIAESTGISRKTFYNNELLGKLVNKYATTDYEAKDEITNLKTKISEQAEKINNLVLRDIDRLEFEHQISKLHNEIKALQKINSAYKEQHEIDANKIKELTKPVRKDNMA